jgi:uncharacterized protein DUF2628
MSVYTVHAPRTDEADPARFEFIRDGFYFWAFVFGPLWLLSKRLWQVALFYIVLAVVLQGALWLIGVPRATHGLVSLLMHLLVGLEAATLHRWTLDQNEWKELGVVSADRYETAERRFFDGWVANSPKAGTPPPPQQPIRMPPPASDIIGFFPEPQSRQ